jgi:hypothetical protein
LQKLASKSKQRTKKRSASNETLRRTDKAQLADVENELAQFENEGQVQIEPLIDPMTGANIFHIACHNLFDAKILTRNTQANCDWFSQVLAQILRAYA